MPISHRLPSAALVLACAGVLACALPIAMLPSAALAEGDPAAAAGVDVLVLKDGRRLEGVCVAEADEGITFRAGGTTRFYARDQIERRERAAVPAAPVTPPVTPQSEPGATPPSAPPGDIPRPEAAKKAKAPKALSEESRAWIRDLAARAGSEDETVRRSVAAGLRACGPLAVPTIREVAATATEPRVKAFLEAVAAEMSAGKGDRGPKGTLPPAGADPRTDDPAMGGAPAGGDPAKPGAVPGAGKRPEPGRGMRGGMFEKLSQELELRDDQRQPFMAVLAGMERSRGQAVREIEGGGSIEAGRTKLTEIRTATLDGARGILDAGQMEAFEIVAERFFGEMQMRLEKIASKRGLGGTPATEPKQEPAPDAGQPPK